MQVRIISLPLTVVASIPQIPQLPPVGEKIETDVRHRTKPFTIPAVDLDKATHGHFTYDPDVLIDSASHEITIAMLDDVSKEFGVATVAVAR